MENEFTITDEMADEALKLDNQLCFPLYAASRRIISAYTPFLKPLGADIHAVYSISGAVGEGRGYSR